MIMMYRIADKVAPEEFGSPFYCWNWKGTTKDNGYGVRYGVLAWRKNGKRYQGYAHRVSYLQMHATIPDGYEIDHLCRNTLCVNPAHLEAVTRRQNLLRGNTVPAKNAAKTRCPRGHEYDDANTHRSASGRKCRACGRERRRRYVALYPDRARESKRRRA